MVQVHSFRMKVMNTDNKRLAIAESTQWLCDVFEGDVDFVNCHTRNTGKNDSNTTVTYVARLTDEEVETVKSEPIFEYVGVKG